MAVVAVADAAAAELLLDVERDEVTIEDAELETAATAADVEGNAELELIIMLDDEDMIALVEFVEDEEVEPVVVFPPETR